MFPCVSRVGDAYGTRRGARTLVLSSFLSPLSFSLSLPLSLRLAPSASRVSHREEVLLLSSFSSVTPRSFAPVSFPHTRVLAFSNRTNARNGEILDFFSSSSPPIGNREKIEIPGQTGGRISILLPKK